jgi:hypothetical protein
MQVVAFSWPGNAPKEFLVRGYEFLLQNFCNLRYKGNLRDYSNLLLIIDEAQNSYRFTSFWIDLVKLQAQEGDAGPYIAMFSSFGSPSSQVIQQEEFDHSPPPFLKPEQRISMRPLSENNPVVSLYFNKSEFLEVVGRFSAHTIGQPFDLEEGAMDFLFDVTAGHPGCTSAILHVLLNAEVTTL